MRKLALILLTLSGCATVPADFVPGAKADPPQGCIEQRQRNPKAEC